DHIKRYKSELIGLKRNHENMCVGRVFDDEALDVSLPGNTVVWHQIKDSNVRSPTDPVQKRRRYAFAEHFKLQEGCLVQYDHVLSTTIKSHWLGTVGGKLGQPLNTTLPEDEDALV